MSGRRFSYSEMRSYLANGTDVARREGWPLTDTIRMVDGKFRRGDFTVPMTPEDEAAEDWVVYRKA